MMANKIAPKDNAAVYEENGKGIGGQDVLVAMGQLFNYAREKQITKREVERYRAMRDTAITHIMEQSRLMEKMIDNEFELRRRSLEKDFEIIDAGLAQNDYTKINMGLQHITETLKHNPFKIFEITTARQRHQMLEAGEFSLE
jgi:hypothetical protein